MKKHYGRFKFKCSIRIANTGWLKWQNQQLRVVSFDYFRNLFEWSHLGRSVCTVCVAYFCYIIFLMQFSSVPSVCIVVSSIYIEIDELISSKKTSQVAEEFRHICITCRDKFKTLCTYDSVLLNSRKTSISGMFSKYLRLVFFALSPSHTLECFDI